MSGGKSEGVTRRSSCNGWKTIIQRKTSLGHKGLQLSSRIRQNGIANLKLASSFLRTPLRSLLTKHTDSRKSLALKNSAVDPKNVVAQGETARWIFKRRQSHQLGYMQELKRKKAENEVRLLFQLWDFDESGTLEPHEILRGLIRIGLGAGLKFTKEVILHAFNADEFAFELSFNDFKSLLLIEPKLKKVAKALSDHAARKLNTSTLRAKSHTNVFSRPQP